MAYGDYTVVIAEEEEPRKKNIIDWPEGFVFDSDEDAERGQLVTVRVKDDDGKLCVTEFEGIAMPGYEEDEDGE